MSYPRSSTKAKELSYTDVHRSIVELLGKEIMKHE